MAMIALAHAARKARPGTEVLIVDGQRTPYYNDVLEIARFRPHALVTGTYAYTSILGQDYLGRERQVIEALRKNVRPDLPIIVGGHEASSNPAGVIDALQPQLLFKGEGEVSFGETVRSGFNMPELDSSLVSANIFTTPRGNRSLVIEAAQPFDLDQFPLPTEFVSIFPEGTRWDQAAVNIGRGCIGRCTFCGGAVKPFGEMSPERVVEHLLAWEGLGYSYFELLSQDFVRRPKHAGAILQAINYESRLRGKSYFMFARPDQFARALDVTLRDGTPARDEWEIFLAENQVEIETGAENFNLHMLLPKGFEKYRSRKAALQHPTNLESMLKAASGTPTRVTFDLIFFTPNATLRGIRNNYEALSEYAGKYPNLYVEPHALFREFFPYVGTRAAAIFGDESGKLKPYEDRRVKALLHTLRAHKDYYRCSDELPLTQVLDRILNLIAFFERESKGPTSPPSQDKIDRYIGVVTGGEPVYLP